MKDAERIAELEAALRRSELLVEQLQAQLNLRRRKQHASGGVDERAAMDGSIVEEVIEHMDRVWSGEADEDVTLELTRRLRDFARAALAQSERVPEGWRPVPVESLSNILRLIDPEPVRLPNGDTMVFKNPHAAAALREISAEFRAMLAVAQHNRIMAATVPAGCKVVKVELLRRISDPFTSTSNLLEGLQELRAILEVKP